MSRIIADTIAFGKQYMRSGVAMFFAFAFPILLILIFGAIFSSQGEVALPLPVQDLDEGPYSTVFLNILANISVVDIEVIPSDVDISEYISDESLLVALEIPADFSSQVAAILADASAGPVNLTLYGDQTTSTYGTMSQVVRAAIDGMNYGLLGESPIVGFEAQSISLEDNMTFMDFFLPGVVGLVVMTNTLYTITSICAEYKNRGYFKLLATTNIKKHEWLLSKFIFYTVLLFASLLLTFAIGQAVFDMTSSLTPLAFAFIAAGGFLFLAMGMLLGTLVKDPESASAIANAVGFPMMFLSGIFFNLDGMPTYMQAISKVFPLTYFNNGLRATMIYDNTEVALVNLAIVIVLGLVFFVLGSKLLSWKER
jgi:ABC-2 type transport system permease protein